MSKPEDRSFAVPVTAMLAEHYKILSERNLAESIFYQAQLFHAWKSLAQQQKGLRRQAKKIKRQQQRIAELTPNADIKQRR